MQKTLGKPAAGGLRSLRSDAIFLRGDERGSENIVDDIDRALLRELQRDADQSLLDLGETVGLSASAVQRRIGRLKADGVISGVHAKLDQHKLGLPVTIVTTIRLERDGVEHTRELIDTLKARPEVQVLHSLAGQLDLLIITVVGDLADYANGVLADLEADNNVSRLETNVSLGVFKSTHELPV